MAKSLFDHLNAITKDQDPKYWDKLDESDRRTWSNFMIHRFLSMNKDWVEILAEIQPYTQTLPPKQLYLALIGIIPKGRHFLKYMNGKSESKYESFLVDLIGKNFECSKSTSLEYCDILYSSRYGRESILDLCELYGIDKKEITKLKLKV